MKIKAYRLEGNALNYAVMRATGDLHLVEGFRVYALTAGGAKRLFDPAFGSQGDAIIDRERICTVIGHDGVWLAYLSQNYGDEPEHMTSGVTRREAAMRCFVLSKLGKVEIPLGIH